MHDSHLAPKAETEEFLFIHSFAYSFSLFLLSNTKFELNGTMARAEQRIVRKTSVVPALRELPTGEANYQTNYYTHSY